LKEVSMQSTKASISLATSELEHALNTPVDPAWWAEAMRELRRGRFIPFPLSRGNGSQAKSASELPILRLDQFIAQVSSLPNQDYIIDPILPAGQVMLICGQPWTGKSFEAQRLAVSFPNGGTFHGLRLKRLIPLYITWEGASKGIMHRFSQLIQGRTEYPYVKMETSPIYLNDPLGKAKFMGMIRDVQAQTGISLVIVDSFPYTIKGDYSKADVVNVWWAAVQEIATSLQLTLIIIWELTKPIIFRGEEINPYDLSRLRGAYSVAHKVNTVVAVGDLKKVVKSDGKSVRARVATELVVMKAKDCERLPPLRVQLNPTTLCFEDDEWVHGEDGWDIAKPKSRASADDPLPDYFGWG
jgi:hypothetical protein